VRWRWWGVSLAISLAGCSSSWFDGASILVVTYSSGTNFLVLVTDQAANCPLSPSATLSIDGQGIPFTNCTGTSQTFGGNPPFSLRVTDRGQVADMDFDDLDPGTKATLIPDSPIPAGGNFAISIPPELQGRSVGDAQTLNTIDGTTGTVPTTSDGQSIAMQAPAQAGSYTVTVPTGDNSSPNVPGQVTSCTGGARCAASAATLLGPVVLVVSPVSAP
jgi:hypothetical protein